MPRITYDTSTSCDSIPRDHLHWLRARERMSFKVCVLTYKAMHDLAPCYLNEICIPVSTVFNLSALRSAARGELVVPKTRLQLGNRAFCVAVRSPETVYHWTFVRHLYIINVQKHAQDTSFLTFLLY